ncbi:MAG: Phosphocholine transferase AnkX [Pseudomonadota bacterium]
MRTLPALLLACIGLASLAAAADAVAPRDADGTTALHWAVHRDDLAAVDRLIRAGADAKATNDFGATPMSEAAVVGNPKVIAALLAAGADPDSTNEQGQTALMVLARTSNVSAATLLLRKGAKVNATEKLRGQTALMWAAAESQPAMVRALLAAGADPNLRTTVNESQRQVSGEPRAQYRPAGGYTALMFAARQGCLDCVKALVGKGAKIDYADPEGVTPLILAVNNFWFDTGAWLLDHGANPNIWDWWGRTALYCAVDLNTIPRGGRADLPSLDRTTSLQMIEKLLKAGANPNLQLKLLPPYRAVGADRGADTMLSIGTTPLIRAAKAGDAPAIKLLLAHGALPDLPQQGGITPLMAAAGVGSTNIDTRGSLKTQAQAIASIELLLGAGADINLQDKQGRAALHGAAFWGWDDVVSSLASHKARLDLMDAKGLTPRDHALGKAGGQGRGGQGVSVNTGTAKLLEELMAAPPQAAQPTTAALD